MLMMGLRPRLNVRQRKDPPLLPHSRLFPLQFRPVILYSEQSYHWVLEDINETDKIYTSRLVPQKLERAPPDSCRSGSYRCFYARGL
ncbi:hypothetical protein B9P82_09685 [Citrobacter sp. L55]|nr:hypothetical protein B9P82_09685 [Citrobacter sp. L55]